MREKEKMHRQIEVITGENKVKDGAKKKTNIGIFEKIGKMSIME